MIAAAQLRGQPLWIMKRAPWVLVATHAPIVFVPVYAVVGLSGPKANPWLIVPLTLAVLGLQLRHSFAAARGERPDGWRWTFALLVVLVYLPLPYYSWSYASMQSMVVASAAMLLCGRLALVAPLVPIAGTGIWAWYAQLHVFHHDSLTALVFVVYWTTALAAMGAALVGAARLIQLLGELYAARTELAEVAIGRERVRVSRDLHDLLGQSLSAVSLKGDLAIRLLPRDTERARAEIESLTLLARDALHDVRQIARDRHTVSLRRELDAAAALLDATGVAARVDGDLPGLTDLGRPARDVLAWAVREGTTNLLRHSDARECAITVVRSSGQVRLSILNDGLRPVVDGTVTGSGLEGLRARAKAVAGTVTAGPTGTGWFRLVVELPAGEA